MLKNGSFTEGWEDMPPAPGHLINQRPNHWTLRWLQPGAPLFEASDTAQGVPECVHKLSEQLPPNEQLGGPDALILEGDAVYKIFHANGAFGAELSQTVTGLEPGSEATLTVPVLAVLHDETDPFGAESGVWVDGAGGWVDADEMGNRKWFRHRLTFEVGEDGRAEIIIRVKSKWNRPKDFFIDGIQLEAVEGKDPLVVVVVGEPTPVPPKPEPSAPDPDPSGDDFDEPHQPDPTPPPPEAQVVGVSVPEGMKLITAESDAAGVIVVVVPRGTAVESS